MANKKGSASPTPRSLRPHALSDRETGVAVLAAMRRALFVGRFTEAQRTRRLRNTQSARELALELGAHRRRQGRAPHCDAERVAQESELEEEQLPGATLVAPISPVIDRRGNDPVPRTGFLRISGVSAGRDRGRDERGGQLPQLAKAIIEWHPGPWQCVRGRIPPLDHHSVDESAFIQVLHRSVPRVVAIRVYDSPLRPASAQSERGGATGSSPTRTAPHSLAAPPPTTLRSLRAATACNAFSVPMGTTTTEIEADRLKRAPLTSLCTASAHSACTAVRML